MRKSLNELHLNGSNQPAATTDTEEQQYAGEPISKDVQLNFENLISIDAKLNSLADCLKKNNI